MTRVGGLGGGGAHSLGRWGLGLDGVEMSQEGEGILVALLALSLDTDRHLLE